MNTKLIVIGICLALLMLSGCMEGVAQPFEQALTAPQIEHKPDAEAMKRFQDTNQQNPTAVESAIELSKKYAALTEEAGQLKLENQTLRTENKELAKTVSALQAELNQANKELTQANDMLIEMRVELNNWKMDVLGFRDEMRKAEKVQLETLVKILKVLGGEVKDNPAAELQSQTAPSTAP